MSAPNAALTTRKPTARSAITNGSRLLAGLDGRSSEARRYRDLCAGFADALAGEGALTEAQRVAVRRAAELTVIAEQQRARALRGEPVDPLALVRLEGMVARAVRALGIPAERQPKRRRSLLAALAEGGAAP